MDIKTYLFSMPVNDRIEFAKRCGSTYGHVRNVAYGHKPCSAELAMEIERATSGAVRCEELRPDLAEHWAYLRSTPAVPPCEAA